MKLYNRKQAVITAVIFSISLLGLLPSAQAHDGNASATEVHACLKKHTGRTRIIRADQECKRRETTIHWAIMGPAGLDGINGENGADGSNGTNGVDGADGSNGIDGVDADQAQLDALQAQVDFLQALVDEFHPVTYAIGDEGPAGGIVFHVIDDGVHGLEAAPENQGEAEWGCIGTEIPGADGQEIGDGAQNTANILAGCNEVGIAAKIAADYTHNGYTGWFLPSILELELLGTIGIDVHLYWSSTQDTEAHAKIFIAGAQFGFLKEVRLTVHPIRAF